MFTKPHFFTTSVTSIIQLFFLIYATTGLSQNKLDSLVKNVDQRNITELHRLYKKSKSMDRWQHVQKLSLDMAIYHGRTNAIDSSLYYARVSEQILNNHQIKDERLAGVYKVKSVIYGNFKMNAKSLDYLQKASNLYKTLGNDKMVYELKNDLANIYTIAGEYEKAVKVAKEILAKDTYKTSTMELLGNSALAFAYSQQKKYHKSTEHYYKALIISEEKQKTYWQLQILGNIAENYKIEKKYDQALEVISQFDSIQNISNKAIAMSIAQRTQLLGEIYLEKKEYKKAEKLIIEAVTFSKQNNIVLLPCYGLLSKLYKEKKDWEKASLFDEKRITMLDSIGALEKKEIAKSADLGYQLIEEEYANNMLQKENTFLEEKNEQQKSLLTVLVILALVSLVTIFLLLKYRKKKKEVKSLKANEKKILENQIIERENELTATLMYFNHKMAGLQKINSDFFNALQTEEIKSISKIKDSLNSFIDSNTDIKIITERIETQFPGITSQLKTIHPNLSANDIRHCLLIKLHLSIKESSTLLNVSREAVKMARIRVKKKMKLPENLSLSDYLNNITTEIKSNKESKALLDK